MQDATVFTPALADIAPQQRVYWGYLAEREGTTREAYERHLKRWFDWCADRVELRDFRSDSQDPATIEAVGECGPFDFVFIDGDHTYDGVRADWLAYSPLVRSGGLVAFHDTWPNGDRHEPGVVRWVDELRHHLPSIEWTDPDGVGICAFRLP